MTKTDEILEPTSCFNRAIGLEILFVLAARDAAAPDAIRAWALRRVQLGLNKEDDKQILDAVATAQLMDEQRDELRSALGLQAVVPMRYPNNEQRGDQHIDRHADAPMMPEQEAPE